MSGLRVDSGAVVSTRPLVRELSAITGQLNAIPLASQTRKRIERDADGLITDTVEWQELGPKIDPASVLQQARAELDRVAANCRAAGSIDTPTVTAVLALYNAAARVDSGWAAERAQLQQHLGMKGGR